MRLQWNAGSLRTCAAFFIPNDGRRVAYGVGQGPVAEAVGGIVVAGRDAVSVGSSREKVRRNLLMEAPCSLTPPGRSADVRIVFV